MAPQLGHTVQLDSTDTKYSSVLAMLAIVAVPVVGLWEVFRTDELHHTHVIRMFLVLIAGLLLALAAFVQDYLANRAFLIWMLIWHTSGFVWQWSPARPLDGNGT